MKLEAWKISRLQLDGGKTEYVNAGRVSMTLAYCKSIGVNVNTDTIEDTIQSVKNVYRTNDVTPLYSLD